MTLAPISSGPTAAASRSPVAHAPRRHCESNDDTCATAPPPRSDGPGRRNPLVAAMMSALQSLMPSRPDTPAAATNATTPAATTATTASTAAPAGTLRDAAYAFAHELYSALRGSGSGGRGDDDGGERPPRHHHHHHHHRSEGNSGYGDLAQRLTALAQKLDGGAQASATTRAAAAPVTQPAATASPVPTVTATPAASTPTVNITININLGGTAAANPAPKPAASPLVDAFKHLFDALNPSATATGSSPTERLVAFLRQMAQSLNTGSDATDAPSVPRSGGLLSVSA
jgi:hypothetical protein